VNMATLPVISRVSADLRHERMLLRRQLAGAASMTTAWRLLADLIEDPPAHVSGMHVGVVIRMCRKTGWARMRRLLIRADIRFESNTVGRLSDRQRAALVRDLREGL
jgi:hypothetical protein